MNQHQKLKINHTTILNEMPVNNYIIQNPLYKEQIKRAAFNKRDEIYTDWCWHFHSR